MKVKHICGYGCVNMKKTYSDANTLIVVVTGEHECGLAFDDRYDTFNWIVKRFDKSRKDYMEIENIEIEEDTIDKKGTYRGYEDVVTYTFHFRKGF